VAGPWTMWSDGRSLGFEGPLAITKLILPDFPRSWPILSALGPTNHPEGWFCAYRQGFPQIFRLREQVWAYKHWLGQILPAQRAGLEPTDMVLGKFCLPRGLV